MKFILLVFFFCFFIHYRLPSVINGRVIKIVNLKNVSDRSPCAVNIPSLTILPFKLTEVSFLQSLAPGLEEIPPEPFPLF